MISFSGFMPEWETMFTNKASRFLTESLVDITVPAPSGKSDQWLQRAPQKTLGH